MTNENNFQIPRLPPSPEFSAPHELIPSNHTAIRDSVLDQINEIDSVTDPHDPNARVTLSGLELRRLIQNTRALAGDQKSLEKSSKIDDKAGLINHATTTESITRLTKDRERQVALHPELSNVPFCHYVFLDLDNFKHVNDVLTNPIADMIIADIGKNLNFIMNEGSRDGDFAMRHGGDEFGLWFPELFSDPQQQEENTNIMYAKVLRIMTQLHEATNHNFLNDIRYTDEQKQAVGQLSFSAGLVYPTLDQLRAVSDSSDGTIDSAARHVYRLATQAEQAAKGDKSTTTLVASNGLEMVGQRIDGLAFTLAA